MTLPTLLDSLYSYDVSKLNIWNAWWFCTKIANSQNLLYLAIADSDFTAITEKMVRKTVSALTTDCSGRLYTFFMHRNFFSAKYLL